MNSNFPMQNEMTEVNCNAVKDCDEEIEKKFTRFGGCRVRNMKKYILSDLCITVVEKSIPTTKECLHTGKER